MKKIIAQTLFCVLFFGFLIFSIFVLIFNLSFDFISDDQDVQISVSMLFGMILGLILHKIGKVAEITKTKDNKEIEDMDFV